MAGVQESFRALNYVSLSAITLMAYDWALSFRDEVTHVWRAQWSIPKALYIISRYYPVVYLTVLYFVRNLTETSYQLVVLFLIILCRCSNYTWYHGFGGVICILPPVTAVFTKRVAALYKDSRTVVIFVWFLWIAETAGELITTVRVTIGEHREKTITYGPGCLTVTGSDPTLYRSELVAWTPALFGSLSLFLLTLYRLGNLFPKYILGVKGRDPGSGAQRRVSLIFMTDGTIYFFFIFVATLLTMISDLLPNLSFFNDWWNPWFILIYSLSGAKLILNLRKNASLDGDVTRYNVSEVGDMEFWDPEFSSRSKLPDDMEMTGLDPNEGFV